jgi:hypothetical protein
MSLAGSFCISIDLLKGRSDHPYSGCDARSLISLCIPCISRKLDSEEATNLSSDAGFVALLKTIFIYFRWIMDDAKGVLSHASMIKKEGTPILGALMLRVLEKACPQKIPLDDKVLLEIVGDCTMVIFVLFHCGFSTAYRDDLIGGTTFREEAESLILLGKEGRLVSLITLLLCSFKPSPDPFVRVIRGNIAKIVANALVFEFETTTGLGFAQAVLGKTKLLTQIIESIRYSLMLILSYSDEHSRSCPCVARTAVNVIERLTLYLVYPQISSMLSNKIEMIRALESKCAVFPDEFKKTVNGFLIRFEAVVGDNSKLKCENPRCLCSNPASKSCSKCGVRYCSQECQIEHWMLPQESHKDIFSADSLIRLVEKVYSEREVANDHGYLFRLEFNKIPLELKRVGDYRVWEICEC